MKKLLLFLTITSIFILNGCNSLDNPGKGNEQIKPEDEYFDFSTAKDIKVELNYGYTGYKFLVDIYTADPYTADGMINTDIEPVFRAYTDNNCSINSTVRVPSSVKKLYAVANAINVPECIDLDITDNSVSYNNEIATKSTLTKADEVEHINIGTSYITIDSGKKLYGLYDTYSASRTSTRFKIGNDRYYYYNWTPSNNAVPSIYSSMSTSSTINGTTRTLGSLLTTVNNTISKNTYGSKPNNSSYITDESHMNLSVIKPADKENFEGAQIDLVFLNASGWYSNAMAYYYYKTDEAGTVNVKNLPKYVVYPRSGYQLSTNLHYKIRLQFFGESYNEAGIDTFPEGYTIGWVLISMLGGGFSWDSYPGANMSTVNGYISSAYGADRVVYSNESANKEQVKGCMALYDSQSGATLYGFEDMAYQGVKDGKVGDNSFEDYLFYVEATPVEAIYDPDKPIIEDDEVLTVEHTTGTLAFEDIWPSGGDYDMNDVVVEYDTQVTFNQDNEIKKVVDVFKFVHDGASIISAFGYVINSEVGTIDAANSDIVKLEESNQIIVCVNAKAALGNTFKVTRTGFTSDKQSLTRVYNPFIVLNYDVNATKGTEGRMEVHLPKYDATSWIDANLLLTGDDAWYIAKEGNFPFAVELFGYTGWTVVDEKMEIGSSVTESGNEPQYPLFRDWVNSNGNNNADWYLWKDGVRIEKSND